MPIDVENRHPTLKVNQRWLAVQLRRALRQVGRPRAEVSVSLVTDEEIQSLNKRFRGVDAVTDVLSFALTEAGGPQPVDLLGDIVVSLDTALRQAEGVRQAVAAQDGPIFAHDLAQEVVFLSFHGLLHLLGHDHEQSDEAEVMEALENALMLPITPVDLHDADRSRHGL